MSLNKNKMADQLMPLNSDQNQIISQNLSNIFALWLGFKLSVLVTMGDIFILMKFSGIAEILRVKISCGTNGGGHVGKCIYPGYTVPT